MKPLLEKTLIFAHRGARAYLPDNTLEAFELAHKMGAEGIELDVRFSADGAVVVCHETKLDGMTDATGPVAERTLAELKALDVGYGFYTGEKKGFFMPTLDEVYDLVAPLDMIVNVEIKVADPAIVAECDKIAVRHGMRDKIIYSSFNHYQIKRVQDEIPGAFIAPLYTWNLLNPWNYCVDIGAPAVHPHFEVIKVTEDYVKKCHEKGIRVHPWTVNGEDDIRYLLEQGVDVIMTDYPDVGVRLRDEMK